MLYNFLKFNNEQIINPTSWKETSEVVENVNQSEAGTDIVSVTRFDKLTVNCTFQVSDYWFKKLKDYSKLRTITVTYYDAGSGTTKTRTMRIRNFSVQLQPNSLLISTTNGLWVVTFDLKEV